MGNDKDLFKITSDIIEKLKEKTGFSNENAVGKYAIPDFDKKKNRKVLYEKDAPIIDKYAIPNESDDIIEE